jgi:hypothetical protein
MDDGMTRIRRAARLTVVLLGFAPNAMAETVLYGEPKVWISLSELDGLPTHGAAWDAIRARSAAPIGTPSLANQDDPANVTTLALALYAARTRDGAATNRFRAAR